MRVIGISGFAGAGKTTAANHLERHHGYTRRHIATPLRAMLRPLLTANGVSSEMQDRYLDGDLKEAMIPEIGVTARHALITLGTEWGRDHVGQDLWVNTWMKGIGDDDSVINDSVRFPNEQTAIHKLDGWVIEITRPGVGPVKFTNGLGRGLYQRFGLMWGVHASERVDRIVADFVVDNDGCADELGDKLDDLMEFINDSDDFQFGMAPDLTTPRAMSLAA